MSHDSGDVPTRPQDVADWFFRDAHGELVLGEPPNRAITIVVGLRLGRWALRRGGLRPGSPLDVALERVGLAALTWWSLDELLRGTTPYRRTIGAAVLLHTLRQWRPAA